MIVRKVNISLKPYSSWHSVQTIVLLAAFEWSRFRGLNKMTWKFEDPSVVGWTPAAPFILQKGRIKLFHKIFRIGITFEVSTKEGYHLIDDSNTWAAAAYWQIMTFASQSAWLTPPLPS